MLLRHESRAAAKRKALVFNIGVILLLFAGENLWLLPKADFVRVVAEAFSLATIAGIEFVQSRELDGLLDSNKRRKRLSKAQEIEHKKAE